MKKFFGKKIKKDKKIRSKIYLSIVAHIFIFCWSELLELNSPQKYFLEYSENKPFFMKKNVFRNFDFVVPSNWRDERNLKNCSERIFFPVLDIYRNLPWVIIRTRYRLLKKNHYFSKMKVMSSLEVIPYKQFPTAWSMRTFHLYIAKGFPPCVSTAPSKTPEFRSLFADLGHFLTSDVILKENFCRLASIWLIGLMKLFALGRIDLANGPETLVSWKGWKVHRKGGYPAAHFEFCRRRRDALRATLGAYVQCCVRIWTPACSQQSIFFCFGLVGVVFVYVVFKEFGSCGFSILFMYNISKLVYVMFMFSNGILWQLIGQNEKHIIFTDPPTHRWKAPP